MTTSTLVRLALSSSVIPSPLTISSCLVAGNFEFMTSILPSRNLTPYSTTFEPKCMFVSTKPPLDQLGHRVPEDLLSALALRVRTNQD